MPTYLHLVASKLMNAWILPIQNYSTIPYYLDRIPTPAKGHLVCSVATRTPKRPIQSCPEMHSDEPVLMSVAHDHALESSLIHIVTAQT